MGSTARSPRVRARVTPHRGQGESLVPLYTRESVSLSPSSTLHLWTDNPAVIKGTSRNVGTTITRL